MQEQNLWHQTCTQESDHEKRAGLICALQALLVLRDNYVAIGGSSGYFFLPAVDAWADWARVAFYEARDSVEHKYNDKNDKCIVIHPTTAEELLFLKKRQAIKI